MNLPRGHDRGMVLIAVLWMVAALSILVAGIARSAREEARIVTRMRQSVEAQGLGDAAIHLALQAMVARPMPLVQLERMEVNFQGVGIAVQIIPLNGLIDINAAPVPLLTKLYAVAGGTDENTAQALAQATVEARNRKDARGASIRFEAVEELLQIPGVDYALYARLVNLMTADLRGSGKVNPMAAPAEVLAVLAGGDIALASRIAAGRDAGAQGAGMDTTALDSAYLDNAATRRYRIEAKVPMADGGALRISRSVDLAPRAREGMPWHTFNSSRGFEPAGRTAF